MSEYDDNSNDSDGGEAMSMDSNEAFMNAHGDGDMTYGDHTDYSDNSNDSDGGEADGSRRDPNFQNADHALFEMEESLYVIKRELNLAQTAIREKDKFHAEQAQILRAAWANNRKLQEEVNRLTSELSVTNISSSASYLQETVDAQKASLDAIRGQLEFSETERRRIQHVLSNRIAELEAEVAKKDGRIAALEIDNAELRSKNVRQTGIIQDLSAVRTESGALREQLDFVVSDRDDLRRQKRKLVSEKRHLNDELTGMKERLENQKRTILAQQRIINMTEGVEVPGAASND